MDPATLSALMSAGGSAGGGAINAWMTNRQNRLSRQWSEKMYDRQYNDNINFWSKQNEYNNPTNQMERLKAAGLNPKLIYGSSSSGAAGQASNINTPDVQQAQFRTPEFGNAVDNMGQFMSQIYDTEIKQAQINNLAADNTVKITQAALNAAQTNRSKYDLGYAESIREISAEALREGVRKQKADTQYVLDENQRRAALNASNLAEAAERILSSEIGRDKTSEEIQQIKARIKEINANTNLRNKQIDLKSGNYPAEHVIWKFLAKLIGLEDILKEPSSQSYFNPPPGQQSPIRK